MDEEEIIEPTIEETPVEPLPPGVTIITVLNDSNQELMTLRGDQGPREALMEFQNGTWLTVNMIDNLIFSLQQIRNFITE
jgi:hypothetical protein